MASKQASTTSEELQECTKEELIARVIKLESHVGQLKNILSKQLDKNSGSKDNKNTTKRKRSFDFRRCNKRHVALKVCYLGWDYQGLVVQEDTLKTIEAEVFAALHRTCLIESRETSNYHRCGRTDKGVSAFGQVFSIDLRSNFMDGPDIIIAEDSLVNKRANSDTTTEIDYAGVLNKVLPPDIRVLAWAPVPADFSARFNCVKRVYKYYFPKGDLDIQSMREASQHFVGCHDFRNFCKMDVANGVVSFNRNVASIEISPVGDPASSDDAYQLYELTVSGQAFLWHQIRCMVAILFLVGKNQENPEIVKQLLYVESNPRRPQYNMALDLPLVLFDCEFENIEWTYSKEAHAATLSHLQHLWSCNAIKSGMIKQMLGCLETQQFLTSEESCKPVRHQANCLTPGCQQKVYKPLLSRQLCESLESRLKHFSKRLKMTSPNSELVDAEEK